MFYGRKKKSANFLVYLVYISFSNLLGEGETRLRGEDFTLLFCPGRILTLCVGEYEGL